MKKLLIAVAVCSLVLSSCSDPKGATAFLTQQGFTDIQITGFDFLSRGKEDLTTTGFTANNSQGQKVRGAVSRKLKIFGPSMVIRFY